MARQRNINREDTRFRVLRLLSQNPLLTQRDLAEAVGISAGSVHYVLAALVAAGMVKLGNFNAADDKRRYAYLLTPHGLAQQAVLTRQFLARKVEEFEVLRIEIDALREELGGSDFGEVGERSAGLAKPEAVRVVGGARSFPASLRGVEAGGGGAFGPDEAA